MITVLDEKRFQAMNRTQAKMVKCVFICSAARSGSTFTDMLLGGHSQMASVGEFSFLGKCLSLDEECSCGAALKQCSQWKKVFDRVREDKGVDLLNAPYALKLWDARAVIKVDKAHQTPAYLLECKARKFFQHLKYSNPLLEQFIPLAPSLKQSLDNTFYLYDLIREAWGIDVIIDSSKSALKAVGLYKMYPDQVRVILLARDGRGVFLSRRLTGVDQKTSLAGWKNYYTRALDTLDKHVPSRHLYRLRYEDLVTRPEEQLNRICDFIGIPYEASMADLCDGERHVINGNRGTQKRRKGGIKADTRWKEQLKGEDLEFFNKHGGNINWKLGYES